MSAKERALARLLEGEPLRLFIGNGLDAVEVQLTPGFITSLRERLSAELKIAVWNETHAPDGEKDVAK